MRLRYAIEPPLPTSVGSTSLAPDAANRYLRTSRHVFRLVLTISPYTDPMSEPTFFDRSLIGRCFAAAFVLFVVFESYALLGHTSRVPEVLDFRVVYCGERAVIARSDPYAIEPLRACEHTVKREANEPDWSVTPYPLPGYAAMALLPFGLGSFALDRAAWIALIATSFVVTAVALATLLDVPTAATAVVLAPSIGLLQLRFGEPVPLAIAALTLAALALARGRPRLAALAAAVATIEPHLGLAACVGTFALAPETRRPLGICAATFAVVSIVGLGVARNVEYLSVFLPTQARAELVAVDQFSISHAAYVLHASEPLALALGTIGTLVALVLGVVVARRFVARGYSPGAIVLVPVAVALVTSAFSHDVEIAAALPAALLLSKRSWCARVAVVLFAMPWGSGFRGIPLVLAETSGASVIAFRSRSLARQLAFVAVATVALFAIDKRLPNGRALPSGASGDPPFAIAATDSSSVAWAWRIRLDPAYADLDPRTLAHKIPLWLALALVPIAALEDPLASALGRIARRREYAGPAPPLTTR